MQEKHDVAVGELSVEIASLKLMAEELERVKVQLEETQSELHSTDEAKQWLERRLPEVEVNICHTFLKSYSESFMLMLI